MTFLGMTFFGKSFPEWHELFNVSKGLANDDFLFIILKTFVIMFLITVIVIFAGRKTVAELTMIQMVIAISIGDAVLMPVTQETSLLRTLTVVAVCVLFLILLEFVELKSDKMETLLLNNKARIVYEDGRLNVKELKKMRYTVDQLEMQLRSLGIAKFSDCEVITVEANGIVGYKLKKDKQPITREEFIYYIDEKFKQLVENNKQPIEFKEDDNMDLFKEINLEEDRDHNDKPEFLQ